MSDEAEQVTEEVVEQEQEQLPPGMQKAVESGWAPEDKWTGDPEDWVDWKEFNFRGQLMDRIKDQSGALNTYKGKLEEAFKAIDDLKAFNKTISEREYKKALRQLKEEKLSAVEDGDTARVIDIDDKIDELKDAVDKQNKQEVTVDEETVNQLPPEVREWIENPENSWYTTDVTLHNFANGVVEDLKHRNPYLDNGSILREMEKIVKKELPHKFKKKAAAVDDGEATYQQRRNHKKQPTISDLDDEQKSVARRFEKLGIMSVDDYIKELQETGDL